MFNKGDTVLYGSSGVCRVEGTKQQELYDITMEYLVLKPVYDENSTVFVPIRNKELMSKITPVLSEKQVYEFIDNIPNEKTLWIDDDKQRKQLYQDIIIENFLRYYIYYFLNNYFYQFLFIPFFIYRRK